MDAELVRRGLVPSRQAAQEAISEQRVRVSGAVAERAARLVGADEPVVLQGPPRRFVGRGGEKLSAALDRFALAVAGVAVLDAGASTGGFTDCLLQRGAAHVTAVDVGRAQLHERLRADPRVTSLERTNIRTLTGADLGGRRFALVVADLSFISLRTVAPALVALAGAQADLVLLVKPQFEAGHAVVSRGRGVVRDRDVWSKVLDEVVSAYGQCGAAMMGAMVSPLRGADGNVEFFVHLRAGATAVAVDLAAVAAEPQD